MKVLIAEDDPIQSELLSTLVKSWGYNTILVSDGESAWNAFKSEAAPEILLLDWLMPNLSGIDVCNKINELELDTPPYIILLTAMDSSENLIEGLQAGANDYVTKPFNHNELKARLGVAEKVIGLQRSLKNHVNELQCALDHVKTLQHILPICSHCHSIRDDQESWQQIEKYFYDHADVEFSHGICPTCMKKHYAELFDKAPEKPNK